MPNVDQNERLVIKAMLPGADRKVISESIANLPTVNKSMPFRGLDAEGVQSVLDDLFNLLIADSAPGETFTTNTNNQVGRDLRGVQTLKDFELKIGSVTNAALGIGTVALMLHPEIIAALPTVVDRNFLVKLYRLGYEEEVKALFREKLLGVLEVVHDLEDPFREGGRNALNLLVAGVSKAPELRKHLNDPDLVIPSYATFLLEKHGKERVWIREVSPELSGTQNWKLSAEVTDAANRLNFRFTTDNVLVKMVYHQKNSRKVKNAHGEVQRTGYEYGMGSPSFNVWIDLSDRMSA